jgi:2-oxoisovalerate dehydrogenase E1 component alpha subunit
MTTVAQFEIEFTRILDETGKLVGTPPDSLSSPDSLIPLYRLMVLTRAFDTKAIALQRTGQLGTYASSLGQEAIGAGVGTAMRSEDVLAPTYREQAAQFARGVTMTDLLVYWGGDERGSDFQGPREDFPICVPIGTQCCHAVGAAFAFKYRKQPRVCVGMLGDGATSRGDFYESMNIAGAWNLPVVFVISNNQWAISMPRAAQSAAETLAQKSIAAGFEGLQVDGNDVLAVRGAMDHALAKARTGAGPTLIEAITYRLHDHTTADSAARYRSEDEVEAMRKRDPLTRTRTYLESNNVWSMDDENRLEEECAQQVEAAVAAYQALEVQGPEAMFDSLYKVLPSQLTAQREAAIAEERDNG